MEPETAPFCFRSQHMTNGKRLSRFIVLVTIVAALASLAHAQVRATGSGIHFNIPAAGTKFLNNYYVTDSAGNLLADSVVKSPMVPDGQIVLATGVKAYGRSNCLSTFGPSHPDTTFISFAKNGDLYVLHRIDATSPPTWDWLPFTLQPGKLLKTKPTREVYFKKSAQPWVLMHRREITVVGHDTVSVEGKVYDCVKLVSIEIRTEDGVDYKNAYTYWYSPEVGLFLRTSFGWNGPYFMYQQVTKIQQP